MDYSLLVGVIDETQEIPDERPLTDLKKIFTSIPELVASEVKRGSKKAIHSNQFVSTDGRYRFLLGIIDTFTSFGGKKRAESWYRAIFQGKGVSCVNPAEYQKRFFNFLTAQMVPGENVTQTEP